MQRGDPMELHFEGLEKHEKNGVICIVIMFTSRVMVIEMSQVVHFLYFLLVATKR